MSFTSPRSIRWNTYLLALLVILIDQLSKYWAERVLAGGKVIPLIGNHLMLGLAHNTGAAFGLFASANLLLILLAAVASIFLIAYGRFLAVNKTSSILVAFILGGALGNLIDRIRAGYVIDFIASSFWPTFNVADIAITFGAILLVWTLLQASPNNHS